MRLLPVQLISLILLYTNPTHAIWPFPPKRFTGNALINAGSMGLDKAQRVVAFGDFDGDQFLDVVSLSSDQRTVQLQLWNHELFQYELGPSFQHPTRIHNIVPGDFTHNGKLDLLVMSQGRSDNQLEMTLYPALPSGGFDVKNMLDIDGSTAAQPIPFDMDGDMKIDLLGIPSKGSTALKVWQNTWNSSAAHPELFEIMDVKFEKTPTCVLANPHSSAVVDLNGDCLADLFLVCDKGRGAQSFEIWLNSKDQGFKLAQTGALPHGVGAISFADMDRDGTIDFVFTACSSVSSSSGLGTGCSLNIAYNKQMPICSSSGPALSASADRTCRPVEELCFADPNFKFDLNESEDNDAFASFPISDLFTSQDSLLAMDTSYTPSIPLAPKLGDADLDGYPDILLIVNHTPKLLYSVPCNTGGSHCKNGKGRRGFQEHTKGTDSLAKIKDARGVAWADLDEDGTLDILVQRTGGDGEGTVTFIQNNFYYDAFFLKAIVLNGACDNGVCVSRDGEETYRPFGVSYSGATYKYTVLDTSGKRSAAQVAQLPQTSYQSLLTPYSFFGLGRTNNYIENLFVGATLHSDVHFINLEGVIPNSKLVVSPPSPEGDAWSWKKELFLRPGEWIPWVTVTVIVGTAGLAVIVFVLHLNEKREDELERRKVSHHINFDAL